MIIFDVDGTLIGGEQTDWACFEGAFAEAAGSDFPDDFFATLEEVTARAIVHRALAGRPLRERVAIEAEVRAGFCRRLEAAVQADAGAFPALGEAAELLADLQARRIPVALATGDWRQSVLIKLRAARLPIGSLPLVTSSDHERRCDIIARAAARLGTPIDQVTYVGDGLWDLRATQQLGCSFLGCGAKQDVLRQRSDHVLRELKVEEFWSTYDEVIRAQA
jgi:phosphoglycolate phosphatase-like HAD superfamily hydrolase